MTDEDIVTLILCTNNNVQPEEDKGETTAEPEREVEAIQQRNVVTKEALATCNILQQYTISHGSASDVYDSICTLSDFIECNFQQNLKQTDMGWGKHEWNILYAYRPYMNKLIYSRV